MGRFSRDVRVGPSRMGKVLFVFGKEKQPIQVLNIDTGEVYPSLTKAGEALGYLSGLNAPAEAYENETEFMRRGYRLKLVLY